MIHLLAPALTGKAALVHMPVSPLLKKTRSATPKLTARETWAIVGGVALLLLVASSSGSNSFEVRSVGPNTWETYYYDGQGNRQTLHFTMTGRPSPADIQNALGQLGIVGARAAPAP